MIRWRGKCILNSPFASFPPQKEPWRGGTVCCAWGLGVSSSNTGYVLTVALLEFLIPALTMLSMYASIFRYL